MFPGAQRMNRGNHEISALVRACKANNVTDLIIVHETRGQPGKPTCIECILCPVFLHHIALFMPLSSCGFEPCFPSVTT